MPRRRTLPRRRRQAKQEALAQWRREHPAPAEVRCATVHPDGTRCKGRASRLGYCADCWDTPAR